MPQETPTLSGILSDAGYTCGLFGKSHLEPELRNFQSDLDPAQSYYGFQEFALSEDNQTGPYLDWILAEHPAYYEAVRNNINEFERDTPLAEPQAGHLDAVYVSQTPDELHQTTWITDQTLDFISSQRDTNKPFFAWCSYVDPHHPWNPVKEFAEMYDPAAMPIPERLADDSDIPPNGYYYRPELSDAGYQQMIAAYYAMVTHLDHHIGRILDQLATQGILENSIIIFTSDHGDYNGENGFIRKGLWMNESILRVPMIVRLPEGLHSGTAYEGHTQHVDIAPTLLDYLDIESDAPMQGISFKSVLEGQAQPVRDYAYYERIAPKSSDKIRNFGIAKGAWKLFFYPNSRGNWLIHTANDPHERINLYGQPEHQAIENELKLALLDWLIGTPHYYPEREYPW